MMLGTTGDRIISPSQICKHAHQMVGGIWCGDGDGDCTAYTGYVGEMTISFLMLGLAVRFFQSHSRIKSKGLLGAC